MMKRFLLCLTSLMIVAALGVGALAASSFSGQMFSYAKKALECLAAGDYDRVVTALPFSGVSPSANEWRSLAEGTFSGLSGSSPQTKYAVAYWTGSMWKVAVPVHTPDSDGVEVLVLTSEDGKTFSGYGRSTWGRISDEYRSASHVTWNDEYRGSTSAVVEFDN